MNWKASYIVEFSLLHCVVRNYNPWLIELLYRMCVFEYINEGAVIINIIDGYILQIARHCVRTGVSCTQGRECAWEHAVPAVNGASAFLPELPVTANSVANATPTWSPMATEPSALNYLLTYHLLITPYININLNLCFVPNHSC